MDIWKGPLTVVVVVICLICIFAVRKSSGGVPEEEARSEISSTIVEHPFTLNPILWIILIAVTFMGIVITYYATSFY
ncbi:hypothetical protein [Sporosarcina sp. G11-34]|uniref:hypothetical protein n=1 Tax=Sporosarcina sp. G11-34 TaxID=2849605 RepID=UPI0022A8F037|nr:hypothetical protein [Sporosarcina sp. G11-34]MCZ2257177.1 hypothetical protein [Sporosarcina sp. G11-34]